MGFYEKQSNGTYKAIENIYVGKSAYDEAVDNGFEGTEKAWLSSLHTASSYIVPVPASGWSSSAPYSRTVAVSGILPTDMLFWDIELSVSDSSTAVDNKLVAYNLIDKIVPGNNTITLYCWSSPPTTAINLKVVAIHAAEA